MRKALTALYLAVIILAASSSYAAVPHLINYQGLLTDSSDTKLDGTFNIKFSLYDAEIGGANLWTETQIVSVNEGLFQVTFGSNGGNPLEQADFDPSEVWLGISVEGDPEMSPRRRIVSVPYAYKAEVAETALSTSGSSWFVAGDLGDIEAGVGQISGYPTTQYEYGILWNGSMRRATCYVAYGGGLIFQSIEPLLLGADATSKFRYGGVYFMKGTPSSDDDAATSTSWAVGLWTLEYSLSDVAAKAFATFGLSGIQVWAREL